MTVQIIESETDLHTLENTWNDLVAKNAAGSFFSSFGYIRTTWEHFKGETDRLFILVLKDHHRITGIAPFRISRSSLWGIPARTIKFIAEWEGDRPGIIVEGSEALAWNRIYDFLHSEFKEWDVLDLTEQAAGLPMTTSPSCLSVT